MATLADYPQQGRFIADPGFAIYTRNGQLVPSICIMQPPIRSGGGSVFTVPLKFQFRWDLLAQELLGDVTLKWLLMVHNAIEDPFFAPYVGQQIVVPTSEEIAYYRSQSQS